MARKKPPRTHLPRLQPQQPQVSYRESREAPLPAPEATSDPDPEPNFDDLPNEVPGLDELPQLDALPVDVPEGEPIELPEPPAEAPPSEEDLNAESTIDAANLQAERGFDPAPLDPSPPSWEDDVTPPVVDLPTTSDVVEGLMAEIAQLKAERDNFEVSLRDEAQRLTAEIESLVGKIDQADTMLAQANAISDAALADANAEIIRLRETLAEQTVEIGKCSDQIESLNKLLEESQADSSQIKMERDAIEARLVDSELTRADIEAKLDEARVKVNELMSHKFDRKLWQVFTRPKVQAMNTPAQRLFVIAGSITEAIDRVVHERKAIPDDIVNVVEFKTDLLIV